jgi:hypothetical protein
MGTQTVSRLDSDTEQAGNQPPLVGNTFHAEEVARAARHELDALLRQRSELMKRIGTVKQTLAGLTKLFGCSEPADTLSEPNGNQGRQIVHQTGLTDACRTALLEATGPLRAHQVRDRLRFQGFPLDNHRDPVATVTTILRRLWQYGEARSVVLPDGKKGWEWISEKSAQEDVARTLQNSLVADI